MQMRKIMMMMMMTMIMMMMMMMMMLSAFFLQNGRLHLCETLRRLRPVPSSELEYEAEIE